MARTFNRRPVTIDGPNNSDIKNYTFNYEQWKGIDDGKNFLSVDQSTFSDAQNMYIDSEGLLSSRPAVEPVPESITLPRTYQIENIYPVNDDITIYVCYKDSFHQVIIRYYNTTKVVVKSSTASYSVKYINSNEKLYLFVTDVKNTTTPTKLYIYNKTTQAMLTEAEVLKSIYVPTTKIFTGNNEEEGEAVNIWTTSERYLYYYNDVTGISGDANGKTLTWEGKTLTWDEAQVPLLVKEHYKLDTSVTIIAIGSTGAAAWIDEGTLNYAVNGSVVYSWNLNTYIPSTYGDFAGNNVVENIEFNDAADSLIIYTPFMAYIVSCVSTREDNTLRFPIPTPITDIAGITFNEAGWDRVISVTFTDEKFFAFFVDNATDTALGTTGFHLYVNFGSTIRDIEYSTLTKDSSMYLFDAYDSRSLRIAMNRQCIVVCGNGRILVKSGQSYIRGASKLISAVQLASSSTPKEFSDIKIYNYIATGETGEGSEGQTVFIPYDFGNGLLYLVNNEYTYYQTCKRTNNNTLQSIYSLRNTILSNGSINANALANYDNFSPSEMFVDLRKVYGNVNKIAVSLSIGYGNYGRILDFTKTVYSNNQSTVNVKFTSTEQLLESNDTLYTQLDSTSSLKVILTRFHSDTFELYYDKLGEVTYPKSITDILYLNNYFFAVDNVSYYTENKYNDDGEFLFYIPDKNRNEFDSPIVKFHQIGDGIIGIFFENEIHYAKYDSNISTYRYYKTKLQFGIPKGSDVITSDDSITTYIPTRSGIVALSYQNFISATEQGTVRISDQIFDTANELLFFKDGYIRIVKYRYWIIFYKNLVSRLWVYDTRNQSWWRQILPFGFTQFFIRKGDLIGLRGGVEYRRTEELPEIKNKYMDNLLVDSETTYVRIGWYFKSQKLHLGAPNYFKSIQGMTFFDSAENNYENIFDLETYSYRDKPYVNGEQNVHYDVRMIRTYLLRMHTMKTNEFQFKVSGDNTIAQDDSIRPIKLSSISIRYRITGEVR